MPFPAAFDSLAASLRSTDVNERIEAIKSLGMIRDPRAVELLVREIRNPETQSFVMDALVEIGDPACIEDIIRLLLDDEASAQLARLALQRFGRYAVDPLIEAVELFGLTYARCRAIYALARLEDARREPRAAEILIALLRDENGEFSFPDTDDSPYENGPGERNAKVVGHAIWALGELGNRAATKALLALLDDPERPLLREGVAEALGKIGDPRAVDALVVRLADNKYVAEHAAEALGKIGDPRAVEPLLRLLKNDCWQRRMAAARALGPINDPRAIEPLIACLGDDEWLVRCAAADSLERFGLKLARDEVGGCQQMSESELDSIRSHFGLAPRGGPHEG